MRSLVSGLATTALAAVAIVATALPAHADNPVVSRSYGTAKYVDATDQLCARVAPQAPAGAYAEAIIFDGDRLVKRIRDDRKAGDTAFTCTRNLPIPEDHRYRLVVSYSSGSASGTAMGNSTYFYS